MSRKKRTFFTGTAYRQASPTTRTRMKRMRKIRLGKKVSSEEDSGRCSTDPQTAVLSSNNQSDCGSSDIQTPQPSYKKSLTVDPPGRLTTIMVAPNHSMADTLDPEILPVTTFTKADDLIRQAADIRKQADAFRTRADRLDASAQQIEDSAVEIQAVGEDDRDHVQAEFDATLKYHRVILDKFQATPDNQKVIKDLAICVEEGRAYVHDVVNLGERLLTFRAGKLGAGSETGQESDADPHSDDGSMQTGETVINRGTDVDEVIDNAEAGDAMAEATVTMSTQTLVNDKKPSDFNIATNGHNASNLIDTITSASLSPNTTEDQAPQLEQFPAPLHGKRPKKPIVEVDGDMNLANELTTIAKAVVDTTNSIDYRLKLPKKLRMQQKHQDKQKLLTHQDPKLKPKPATTELSKEVENSNESKAKYMHRVLKANKRKREEEDEAADKQSPVGQGKTIKKEKQSAKKLLRKRDKETFNAELDREIEHMHRMTGTIEKGKKQLGKDVKVHKASEGETTSSPPSLLLTGPF